jgi:hypothetical protein
MAPTIFIPLFALLRGLSKRVTLRLSKGDTYRNSTHKEVKEIELNPVNGGDFEISQNRLNARLRPSSYDFGLRRGAVGAPLAQLVEQLTLNQLVPGSSPGRCTTLTP